MKKNKKNIKQTISDMFLVALAKQIARKLDLKEGELMDKKEWYKSKTIWSGIITILITVYNAGRPLVIEHFNVNLPEIPEWVYTVLGAMGIYGRVTANKKIG